MGASTLGARYLPDARRTLTGGGGRIGEKWLNSKSLNIAEEHDITTRRDLIVCSRAKRAHRVGAAG